MKLNRDSRLGALWQDRWRIAAWLLPALLGWTFVRAAVVPLAHRLHEVEAQVARHRVNIYERAWLDSARTRLQRETDLFRAFLAERRMALNSVPSLQEGADLVRGLAEAHGLEILRTLPALSRDAGLEVFHVRLEGLGRYGAVRSFLEALRAEHPGLYVEELSLRASGSRLEVSLHVLAYSSREGTP